MNFLVRHVLHKRRCFRVCIKKLCTVVVAVFRAQVLVLTINRFCKASQQHIVFIACKERIPLRPPQHLDNIPAGADKQCFQFLNDLTITAHWTV